MNVFALAMMACAAVFAVSSTNVSPGPLKAFTYALHTFLAVVGMFFVTILFCRRAAYHPDDLVAAKSSGIELGKDRPVVAAACMAFMLFAYGLYQWYNQ